MIIYDNIFVAITYDIVRVTIIPHFFDFVAGKAKCPLRSIGYNRYPNDICNSDARYWKCFSSR